MLPIIVITALMYALIMVEANYIASWHVALRLIVKILTGILAYTSLAYIARSEAFNEATSIIKGLLNKGKHP
jgi:hypothetical protein